MIDALSRIPSAVYSHLAALLLVCSFSFVLLYMSDLLLFQLLHRSASQTRPKRNPQLRALTMLVPWLLTLSLVFATIVLALAYLSIQKVLNELHPSSCPQERVATFLLSAPLSIKPSSCPVHQTLILITKGSFLPLGMDNVRCPSSWRLMRATTKPPGRLPRIDDLARLSRPFLISRKLWEGMTSSRELGG